MRFELATPLVSLLALSSILYGAPVINGAPASAPTHLPRAFAPSASPDDIYAFYSPRHELFARQADSPPVPLSELGPPSFPSDIPSCPKCQADYPSLSNCMGAASVFANSTSILNDPMAYINVIRCACTDTFQAVFPQCLDCFQHTDQCYYLGTDPQGTGAGTLVTNIRNICGFGSALLGGVASANSNVGTVIPTAPGSYYGVSTTGAGYHDQSTGAIFQSDARAQMVDARYMLLVVTITALSIVGGGWRTLSA